MNRASILKSIAAVAGGLALVAAFVLTGQASAVRQVSYTLQPVTAAECLSVSAVHQSDGAGSTVIVTTMTFEVKDETGTVREVGATSVQLTPVQRASLATFITNIGVPQFNAENDL